MLGKCLASPLLTFDSTLRFCFFDDSASISSRMIPSNANSSIHFSVDVIWGRYGLTTCTNRIWKLHSTAQFETAIINEEDQKTWESCKQALSAFGFDSAEEDKILGKAFGQIHSPYWGEERKKEVPKFEVVTEILSYLKDLGLTDEDLGKLLKKFPERRNQC